MATPLKSVQSQTIINVSQDAITSPARSPVDVERSPPSQQKSQANTALSRDRSNESHESTQVVKETIEDIPENYRKQRKSSLSDPAQPPTYDIPADDGDDLYEVSPHAKQQPSSRPLATRAFAQDTQSAAGEFVANIETQNASAAAPPAKASTSVRPLSQLFTDDLDAPAVNDRPKVTPKSRLLTQTSKSDRIEPAAGTSTDPPASTKSRKHSNESSTQFVTTPNPSATSKTSAMASEAKSAATTWKQSKTQPAGTSAKAKLKALKAAQSGNSAKTQPQTIKANSKTDVSASVEAQVGPSKKQPVRQTRQDVAVTANATADLDEVDEESSRPGKLPKLRRSMPDTTASVSKKPLPAGHPQPRNGQDSDAGGEKKSKLQDVPEQKQKAGPFVEDDDDDDSAADQTGKISGRGTTTHDNGEPTERPQKSKAAASRKRKAHEHDQDELGRDETEMSAETKKRPGALPGASTRNKRQKQVVTSSWNDDENDDDGVYDPPKSPAKKGTKTTKKSKVASKSKVGSPWKTPRPIRTLRGQAIANDRAKTATSARAVGKMKTASQEDDQENTRDGRSSLVHKQDKPQKPAADGTIKSPQARSATLAMAAGTKTEGKKAVHRVEAESKGMSVKKESKQNAQPNVYGDTQDDAIVLSDNEDDSSSLSGVITPEKPTETTQRKLTAQQAPVLPKTPAAMHSSPPVPGKEATALAALQKTVRAHKPTVINFDKSGPRNQGVAAVKTPGPKSTRQTSFAPESARPMSEARRKNGPSSFATSLRTGKSVQRASSSNIASNVGDALSNLNKKPREAIFQMSPDPEDNDGSQLTQQDLQHPEVHPVAADDEFTNIDTYNDEDDTLVQSCSSPKPGPERPITGQQMQSQIVEAPAATEVNVQKQDKPMMKRKEVTRNPVETQPSTSKAKSPKGAPQKPRKAAPTKMNIIEHGDAGESAMPREKRPLPIEHDFDPAPKRMKADVSNDNILDPGTRRTRALQASLQPEPIDSSTPPGSVIETMPPPAKPGRPRKKPVAAAMETVEPEQESAPKQEPVRRVNGRPSRQTTYGSQTVDVHGSPVPSQMVVDRTKTVLETWSQQIGVVSDPDAVEKTLKRQRTHTNDTQHLANDLRCSVPQSHQPESMSSNSKPVPAAPQAASNIVPRLELTHSQTEKLLTKRDPLAKMLDPFSSSDKSADAHSTEHSSHPMSALAHQLEEKMKQLQNPPSSGEAESNSNVIYTEVQKHKVKQNKVPTSTTSSSEDDAEELDDDMAKIRAITSLKRRRQEEEDPDKTLVNDDSGDESQEYAKDLPHQESYQNVAEPELSDPASDDLMSWRKTLKPHQLDLFQELIKTAQRLTTYFIEQENSVLRNVERAHRQKLYAIEQEEIARAKHYQVKKEELKRVRKGHRKDLKKCQSNLLEQLEQKKREKEERAVKAAQWDEENASLEALISRLS